MLKELALGDAWARSVQNGGAGAVVAAAKRGPGTPQPHLTEEGLRGHKSDFPQSQKGDLRAQTWPLPTFAAGKRGWILRQLSPALIASVLFSFFLSNSVDFVGSPSPVRGCGPCFYDL